MKLLVLDLGHVDSHAILTRVVIDEVDHSVLVQSDAPPGRNTQQEILDNRRLQVIRTSRPT